MVNIPDFDQWNRIGCCLKKKFMDNGCTQDGRRPITIAHLEPSAQVS